MKNHQPPERRPQAAFTLVEMLVVIGIIAILAGLITSTAVSVVRKGHIKRVQAEMSQIVSAIESYKARKGFYPPDNRASSANSNSTNRLCGTVTALYYELKGTTNSGTAPNTIFHVIDGIDTVSQPDLQFYFGAAGIANNSGGAASDDNSASETFLKSPGPRMIQASNTIKLLISPESDDNDNPFNPWHYNSSAPKYNTSSYDLWTVFKIGGKTNIICNWNEQPIAGTNFY